MIRSSFPPSVAAIAAGVAWVMIGRCCHHMDGVLGETSVMVAALAVAVLVLGLLRSIVRAILRSLSRCRCSSASSRDQVIWRSAAA
jgi:hypothetical protein